MLKAEHTGIIFLVYFFRVAQCYTQVLDSAVTYCCLFYETHTEHTIIWALIWEQ